MEKSDKKRARVTLYVSPLTNKIIERMRTEGLNLSREVDDMFRIYAEDRGWLDATGESDNPDELI